MILLQIVMVSPGTYLVKNQECLSRTIELQLKNTSRWVFMQPHSNLNTGSKTLYYSLLKFTPSVVNHNNG